MQLADSKDFTAFDLRFFNLESAGSGQAPPQPWASIRPVHNLPAHNRRHHFPRKLPSIKRRVARQRPRLGGFERPALLGIEDRYVREAAADHRSASPKIVD